MMGSFGIPMASMGRARDVVRPMAGKKPTILALAGTQDLSKWCDTVLIQELYDLKTDPYEQNNLISNPEYVAILSTLRKQTEDLLTQTTAIH